MRNDHPPEPIEMSAGESRAARARLGLSEADLAVTLNVTPAAVTAWESGAIGVPRMAREHLVYFCAVADREEAVRAAGLPDCEWVAAWEERSPASGVKAAASHLEELEAHEKSCRTCIERGEFVEGRFGPLPPPPLRGWMRGLRLVDNQVSRLPEWGRTPAWWGMGFLAYTCFAGLFRLPAMREDPDALWAFLLAVPLSTTLGVIVGFGLVAYRRLRSRLRRNPTSA